MEKGREEPIYLQIRPITFLVYTDPSNPTTTTTLSPHLQVARQTIGVKSARGMIMDFTACKSAGLFCFCFFLQGKKTWLGFIRCRSSPWPRPLREITAKLIRDQYVNI